MAGLRLTSTVVEEVRPPLGWRLRRSAARLANAMAGRPRPGAHLLGRRGEDLAAWFLRRHGYTIVARNHRAASRHRAGAGEIDLIAYEGKPPVLVFVEVKTRAHEGMFEAEAAVNRAKRMHLIRVARDFRVRQRYTGPYRFDVVVIYGPDDPRPRWKLHRNAFSV